MKKIMQRLTAIALSALMAVGLPPALLNAAEAANTLKAPAFDAGGIGVYDRIYYGAYDGTPVSWRILEVDAQANKVLVYQDNGFDISAFNPRYAGARQWTGSHLQSNMKDYARDSFLAEERGNVLQTSLVDANSSDQLFPLSHSEALRADYFGIVPAINLSVPYTLDTNTFWFRTPSTNDQEMVMGFGYFNGAGYDGDTFKYNDVDQPYLMRSAFWLDLSEVGMVYPVRSMDNGNPWIWPVFSGYEAAVSGTNYVLAVPSTRLAELAIDDSQTYTAVIGAGSEAVVPLEFTALSAWDAFINHNVHYQIFDSNGNCAGYRYYPYNGEDAITVNVEDLYSAADDTAPETLSPGSYTVKAWVDQHDGIHSPITSDTVTFSLTVAVGDPKIFINADPLTVIKRGTTRILTATVEPAGRAYTWSSANQNIASIDPLTGEITALKTGITSITVTVDGSDVSYTIVLRVTI